MEHDERADTRSILFHATAAAEVLVDLIIGEDSSKSKLMLGDKLKELRKKSDACSPHPIDSSTLEHLSDLLVRLRNRAAHWSDQTSDASLKAHALALQSDLGLRLSKSFIWLVTVSFESFLDNTGKPVSIGILDEDSLNQGEWFVGIDGDSTGVYIASCLKDSPDCQDEIRRHSNRITDAINSIREKVASELGKQNILFAKGDNILFHGTVTSDLVTDLLDMYLQKTKLTASAGIGRTPYQASIALRLAKGEGGGAMKIIEMKGD